MTRRQFLMTGGAAAAVALTGVRLSATTSDGPRMVYRLSVRGRRGSQAAKKHNANHLFATMDAANAHRAHPGDHSRVVPVVVSAAAFNHLFPTPETVAVDLRRLGPSFAIGDCNRDGRVSTDELVRGVQIALDQRPLDDCKEFDRGGDRRVTVDDLVLGINNALK